MTDGTAMILSTVPAACIRCASCVSVAPALLSIDEGPVRIRRQPAFPEHAQAAAAASLCPTGALRVQPGDSPSTGASPPWTTDEPLYEQLFEPAERVRWRLTDVPLSQIDRTVVTPGLVHLVRNAALSELTTYTASARFLQEFADDLDLSQWVAIWLYEETKHPQVLQAWLRHIGEPFDPAAARRARAAAPFMKSRMGTLVSNIISEITAACRYLALSRRAEEPVLRRIAALIAGDEARHGASFYRFAQDHLRRSPTPAADRLAAMKILYMWVFQAEDVLHPVNLFQERSSKDPVLAAELERMDFPSAMAQARRRACAAVSHLAGVTLTGPEQLRAVLRQLAAAAREEARGIQPHQNKGEEKCTILIEDSF